MRGTEVSRPGLRRDQRGVTNTRDRAWGGDYYYYYYYYCYYYY